MNARHIQRLLKLADFLQRLPPHKFNFSTFVERGEKSPLDALATPRENCGTTACAVGWMPAVFPRSVRWCGNDVQAGNLRVQLRKRTACFGSHSARNFEVAQHFFGISFQETRDLFNPDENSDSLSCDATPKQVAASIREFVRAKQPEARA